MVYLLLSPAQLHLAILFDKVLHDLFGHSSGRRVHVVTSSLGQVTRTGKVIRSLVARVARDLVADAWSPGGQVPGYLPSGEPPIF